MANPLYEEWSASFNAWHAYYGLTFDSQELILRHSCANCYQPRAVHVEMKCPFMPTDFRSRSVEHIEAIICVPYSERS